ncbi:hypothetical protein CROQUDRAFT_49156 [Cronartium quercuum f. sp. fusiforme G11]|uniref:ATP-dependent RNA helicase n=1 Tax=Cronartium quercuum f. sp. fusiforme G11 TaxID=708437 RepID=A0A9P6T944_9BASI|nr:hypothetical protein CROQUDRAFT_49156 [Cronartium quercuum f. sp. fusiforme G11]
MGFSRPRYNQKARTNQTIKNQEDNNTTKDKKVSKNKQKKINAYLSKQLKKDHHNHLLKELEQSQSTINDPTALISTSHLNSEKLKTQQQIQQITINIESRKKERVKEIINKRKRKQKDYHSEGEETETDEITPVNSFSGALMIVDDEKNIKVENSQIITTNSTTQLNKPIVLGSALAPGAVIINKKRKIEPTEKLNRQKQITDDIVETDQDSFDSSDSSEEEEASDRCSTEEWNGCQIDDEEEWNGIDSVAIDEQLKIAETRIIDSGRVKGGFRDWANEQLQKVDENNKLELTNEDSSSTTIINEIHNELPCPNAHEPSEERENNDKELTNQKTNNESRSNIKCGPLGTPNDLPTTDLYLHQKTTNVPLNRTSEIMASRSLLPIFAEENKIMEIIKRNTVIVICGETGSGKTTQIPQFLYESGYGNSNSDNPGMIGITQPRRVAAVSMAKRVEEEMGLKEAGIISYQIRYDTNTKLSTRIKFMTDGILLRELSHDFLLNKYSVIIIDEAHERSINTDVLIGILSRIVKLRYQRWFENKLENKPLRLIIMSATLRVNDFIKNDKLFKIPPPLIEVKSRQFDVTIHFNKKTKFNYLLESFKKAAKIHSRLPKGGILIFLTGQIEIQNLCKKLENKFGKLAIEKRKKMKELSNLKFESKREKNLAVKEDDKILNNSGLEIEVEDIELGKDEHELADDIDKGNEVEEDLEALDTDDEDDGFDDDDEVEGIDLIEDSDIPMYILPLYSLLPTEEQMKVFKDPPQDSRLVIVATNVAETSLTIPNIKYVVDSGRSKERYYDQQTGIQSYKIDWISKASAAQRSGRAGRTGPGHCYRLYSSNVFENYFEEFSKPEINKIPIDNIVLQMKSMNIDTVINFPFPTPPDRFSLKKAEISLSHLGALNFKNQNSQDYLFDENHNEKHQEATITNLGRVMAQYPLNPRFSRMLVSGNQHNCLPYVIALVSILSVGDPFLHEEDIMINVADDHLSNNDEIKLIKNDEVKFKEIRKIKRKQYFKIQSFYSRLGNGISDLFKILAIVGAFEFNYYSNRPNLRNHLKEFCDENFVRFKAMEEIHKLRIQITKIVKNSIGEEVENIDLNLNLSPPNELQLKVLRQLITASFIDQVAVKTTLLPNSSTKITKSNTLVSYKAIGIKEDVYIHPSSILFNKLPDFIVFQEIIRNNHDKIYIKGITQINSNWLPIIGKSLCKFSKPLEGDKLTINNKGTLENERFCKVIPTFGCGQKFTGLEIDLDPILVKQKRVGNRWVWV